MNFKTMSPITILLIVVVILVGTVGVIWAVSNWTQTITWDITDTNFSVYETLSGGTAIVTPAALDLGTATDPITLNYYIANNGNVDIRVIADLNTQDATVAWNSYDFVDVPVGPARGLISFTLSDLDATGTATLTFISTTVPT